MRWTTRNMRVHVNRHTFIQQSGPYIILGEGWSIEFVEFFSKILMFFFPLLREKMPNFTGDNNLLYKSY